MSPYVVPIKFALFAFPFIAALIAVPILLFEYHKYGSFSKTKGFVFYTFVFYMLCAYFLVILPLPDRDLVTSHYRDMIQPIPFRFIADFFKETVLVINKPASYLPALLQGVVLQPIFNVVMVLPFGIYMRYFFKKSFKQTLILSFLLSLFFELTQLSGLYGIYPGPYRLFDVDDLMMNTLGGVVGYSLAPALTAFFPSRDDLDYSARTHSQYVSLVRRFMSFIVDHALIIFVSDIVQGLLSINYTIVYFIIFMLYYVGLSYLRGGKTLAQSFLHLRTASSNSDSISLKQLCIRSLLFFFAIDQPSIITNFLILYLPNSPLGSSFNAIIYVLMFLVFYGFLALHYLSVIFSRRKLFFYESLSKTHIENTAQHE